MTDLAPEPAPTPPAEPATAPTRKGFAVTALVLGIVAIAGSWIPFLSIGSIIIGFVGLVFGIVAIVLALTNKAAGKVLAIVGAALSLLAIIFGFISTAAGVAAVDDALGDITSTPGVTSDTDDSDDANSPEPEETDDASTVGTLADPATIGDGTVWTFSSGGDEWAITFDTVEIVDGYSGDVVVVTGTATPTVVEDGEMSTWVSFPSIDWIAEGAVVDDTFDIIESDKFDDYRHVVDLEALAGTEMKFYSTVGLPEGVVPDLMTASTLFGDETIYFATGLAK